MRAAKYTFDFIYCIYVTFFDKSGTLGENNGGTIADDKTSMLDMSMMSYDGSIGCQSAFFPTIKQDDFRDNFVDTVVKIMLLPVKIPYKCLRGVCTLPLRIASEFVDGLIILTLKKLKMSKGEAKTYAREVAKVQLTRMRTLMIFLAVFLVVFSMALAFSGTIYTGLYFYLIPQSSQEQLLYFNYAPVEQSQKQQLDKEQ